MASKLIVNEIEHTDGVGTAVTMAKATTNGVVPMGVVACKEEIYDAVMDASPKGAVELFHGYTYSGIPVSVACVLASV